MFQNLIAKHGASASAVPRSGTAIFITCLIPVILPSELAIMVPYAVNGFVPAIRKINAPRRIATANAIALIIQILDLGRSSLFAILMKGVFSFI